MTRKPDWFENFGHGRSGKIGAFSAGARVAYRDDGRGESGRRSIVRVNCRGGHLLLLRAGVRLLALVEAALLADRQRLRSRFLRQLLRRHRAAIRRAGGKPSISRPWVLSFVVS